MGTTFFYVVGGSTGQMAQRDDAKRCRGAASLTKIIKMSNSIVRNLDATK